MTRLRRRDRWLSAASRALSTGLARWHAYDDVGVERLRDTLVGQWERAHHATPTRRRQIRRAVSLALQHLPAVDPTRDPWLSHTLPPVAPARSGGSVLITGVTGFVGTHLLSFLLQETDRKVVCVVRTPEKLAAAAREYGLDLPDLDARVTFLRGDFRDLTRWLEAGDPAWDAAARDVDTVFHLACNTSFTAQYEILRRQWMPGFAALCDFCARNGAAMHLVGSVGRFAVDGAYRTTRGVWTSCYMRLKHVQCEMAARFFAQGLDGAVVDSAYIIGSTGRAIHPGMHDSLWLVAALQTDVGAGFPGDAAVVPVDLLVRGMWRNATLPAARRARYLNLRLERLLTSEDIGVPRRVEPQAFWSMAAARGLPTPVIEALVPPDIDEKVRLMNSRPFEAPPEVRALFEGLDEADILARNVARARPEFGELRDRLRKLMA